MPDDDAETTAAESTAAESSPAPGSPARPSRVGMVVALVAAVAAVAAVVFALGERGRADDAEADLAARDDVARAAATFGEAYLSFDFDDEGASSDRVLDLVTPDFAADYSETRAPGIEELFANLETTTQAQTTEVFVGQVDGDAARALVVVDVEADSAATGRQTLADLTFVIDLVRTDDGWLVDRVSPAPTPDVGGDGLDTPTTTSTTTP